MEQDRVQRYVKSLEKTIQNNHHQLKESIEDFREMCRLVSPEKHIPAGIAVDIREMYKEILNRLKEIKSIEQLLQGKYRQYYHRDSLLEKEIMEIGFIAKNCYTKFEYTMVQIESIKRLKEHAPKTDHPAEYLQWFHTKENQVSLIKNLRILMELDYGPTPKEVGEERREMTEDRALTLFLFRGDALSLDHLQSQVQLREHDIIERYNPEEVRGILVHLKKVDLMEVKKKFQRLMEGQGLTELKCLLLPIYSPKDFEGDFLKLIETNLKEMAQGELRTLPV